MEHLKLPISITQFDKIITQKYYYVDKTKTIYEMFERGSSYFLLSRPRGFGKTLLLDTLQHMYLGNKKLFKDTYIYDKWDFKKNTNPVIRLNFKGRDYSSRQSFESSLFQALKEIEIEHQLQDVEDSDWAGEILSDILRELHHKHNKRVVVLVDDYDLPILESAYIDKKLADSINSTLISFYAALKSEQSHVEIVFMTGLCLFYLSTFYSGININDITIGTLGVNHCNICGFTEEELKTIFSQELKNLKGISFKDITNYHCGYSWKEGGQKRLYHPSAILRLFKTNKLELWWEKTTNKDFVYNKLKKAHTSPIEIGNSEEGLFDLTYMDALSMDNNKLLFQMGYLAIIDEIDQTPYTSKFLIDFPNEQVKIRFVRELMTYFIGEEKYNWSISQGPILLKLLKNEDFEGLHKEIYNLFANIPFPWKNKHLKDNLNVESLEKEDEGNLMIRDYDNFYLSILYSIFMMDNSVEVSREPDLSAYFATTNLLVELDNKLFIFKIEQLYKFMDSEDNTLEQTLDHLAKGFKDKSYLDSHSKKFKNKKVIGVCLAMDKEKLNIVGFDHHLVFDGRS